MSDGSYTYYDSEKKEFEESPPKMVEFDETALREMGKNYHHWFTLEWDQLKSRRRPWTRRGAWKKTMCKWRLISDGFHFHDAVKTCGLCNLYYDKKKGVTYCNDKCPIKAHTGKDGCAGTPAATAKTNKDWREMVALLQKLYAEDQKRERTFFGYRLKFRLRRRG